MSTPLARLRTEHTRALLAGDFDKFAQTRAELAAELAKMRLAGETNIPPSQKHSGWPARGRVLPCAALEEGAQP